MKSKLSPVWFLKDPLDLEHKEYVLLDYLKSISKNLSEENCFPIIREISKIVRSLNLYREAGVLEVANLKKSEKVVLENFSENRTDESDLIIEEIIGKSLEILYEYSEICLDILKKEESKIKIFRTGNQSRGMESSGILVIRNMITDKITNYFFKSQVRMRTKDGNKEIILLKKIRIKNSYYSLSYEHVYHEILEESEIKGSQLSLHIIEIYENFEEDSEIYKLAKEKFIDKLTKDPQ